MAQPIDLSEPRAGPTGPARTPGREKRRTVFCLRGLLLVALGGLLVASGAAQVGSAGLVLLVLYGASNLLLLTLSPGWLRFPRFESAVGTADIVFVAIAMHLSGAAAGVLPVSCLMMVLVVAVGRQRQHAAAGAAVVSALHAWLVLGDPAGPVGLLPPQLLFLGSIALYFGYLARGIHDFRERIGAENLASSDLRQVLGILETIASSMNLREVTRAIAQQTAEVVSATRCSVLFVHEAEQRCYVIAAHDDPAIDMLELDLQKYPEVRRAIDTRNPVLVQNVAVDPLMAKVRSTIAGLDLRSILVVPMVFGSDLLGTLCLKASHARHEFTERETEFCATVARVGANALKNAALFREARAESLRHRRVSEALARIFELSPGLILTTDLEGNITAVNAEAESVLGYPKGELLGRPWEALIADDSEAELRERVESFEVLSNHPCSMRNRDGSPIDLELNVAPIKDEAGDEVGTIWLGRDVTQLKATRSQLLQAKKLSTIGEVITGVAHELTNPLSGVLGFSELLLLREGQAPDRTELEMIHDAALRCRKIVENLLSFSRETKPARELHDINAVIEKTLEMKRYRLNASGIEIECDLDPDPPRARIDFQQMQQVLLNLINNAEQAMVRAGDTGPSRLTLRSTHDTGKILMEVVDTGEGMDPETLGRAFEPFFTTRRPDTGAGLGLTVSLGVVRDHGGRLWARSRKGEGSTFTMELPADRREAGQGAGATGALGTSTRPIRSGSRILVVDDDPVVLQLFVSLFEGRGYKVDTAVNGKEACESIVLRDYDLVVSDVRMPEMDGVDLYPKLLERRPDLEGRVIFMTAFQADAATARFLEETGAPTLAKPIQITEAVRIVDEMLARPAVAFSK
jgi:PAS domain S-box-containing protein